MDSPLKMEDDAGGSTKGLDGSSPGYRCPVRSQRSSPAGVTGCSKGALQGHKLPAVMDFHMTRKYFHREMALAPEVLPVLNKWDRIPLSTQVWAGGIMAQHSVGGGQCGGDLSCLSSSFDKMMATDVEDFIKQNREIADFVETFKTLSESEKHWQSRKEFILRNFTEFEEAHIDNLLSLSMVWANHVFLGCR
ncbi:C2AIL protein, partial [Polypterus senegalus]